VLPAGRPCVSLRCSEPSWIEELPVHRALWRLQLHFDLLEITQSRANDGDQVYDLLRREGPHRVWSWQSINLDSLGSIDEGALSASLIPAWQADEMNDVYNLLSQFRNGARPQVAELPHLMKVPITMLRSWPALLSSPDSNTTVSNRNQAPHHLEEEAPAERFFQIYMQHIPWSPPGKFSFKYFRRQNCNKHDIGPCFGPAIE
jgi:hypothetical protein